MITSTPKTKDRKISTLKSQLKVFTESSLPREFELEIGFPSNITFNLWSVNHAMFIPDWTNKNQNYFVEESLTDQTPV